MRESRRRRRLRSLITVMLAATIVAAACSGDRAENPPIVVGSFDTLESEVLGELYRSALATQGFPVVHRARIGDRFALTRLMRAGEVDLVPEYLGSSLEVTFGIDATNDVAQSFRLLADAWLDDGFFVMLPAPAQNQAGFAMAEANARALGVAVLSDLAAIAPDLTFGGPPECVQQRRCLTGLADTYGITFGSVVALDTGVSGTIQALRDGTIDVGAVRTTDPAIEDGNLVLLDDDLGLQPNESIVPVLAAAVADRFGTDLQDLLNDISAILDQRSVVAFNRAAASGDSPGDAAEEWLLLNGFGP